MWRARFVVKGAEPLLKLGDRSDVRAGTAEKKAEEFRRVSNILECYSDFVSFLGRLLRKPPTAFESALVKPLQSLAGEDLGWLGQPQQFST